MVIAASVAVIVIAEQTVRGGEIKDEARGEKRGEKGRGL